MRLGKIAAVRRLRLEQLEARLALATFYVSTNGNDANNGSSATPWGTLQKAANVVNPGDTIIVRPGNYVGFDLRRDGTAANRIVFQAEPGVSITTRNAVTPDGINLEGADYVTIDGFTVNNMPRTGIRTVTNHHVIIRNNSMDNNSRWGILTGFSDDLLIENNVASRSQIEHGIYVSNSGDRPVIRNNTVWGNNANGIHMNGDIFSGGDGIITGALVEGNIAYGNGAAGGSGINADGVQDSIFRNNLIYDTHASGISLYQIDGGGGSNNNVVANNTVVVASNGRWALNIQSGSTGNTVRNNVLLNLHSFRGSIDISADSLPGFTSDYNIVMNRLTTDGGDSVQSLTQWRSSTGQDQHSLVATPAQVFVNPAAFDFHLLSQGPAVNAGTSAFAPVTDLEGNTRPQGSAWDIGAYELEVAESFKVTTSTVTATGVAVDFNRAFDPAQLNLYDIQGGSLGPADVTLVGATAGAVRGSVVVDPNLRRLTFIRTAGRLSPDSYTLTLRSAGNGLQDSSGGLLDGDANGVAGGDYVRSFTVTAPPANQVTVSIPDFVRGPQQPVNIPANGTSGIPLSFSNAAGITSATLQIAYDPTLLSITAAVVAAGLPSGASVTLNTTTAGIAAIQFSSPTPLPAGATPFVNLQANVPATALYRSKHLLDISNIVINGGAIPAADDDGVHVAAYFGDVSGNGTYSAQDASLIARLAVGLDDGLELFRLLDPVIAADLTGNGAVSALDTSRALQLSVGLNVAEVPPLPSPAVSLTQGGPDPKLSIAANLRATRGGELTIPVLIDSIVDLTGNGLESADLVIQYDPAVLDVTRVKLGSLLNGTAGGWFIASRIDALAGRVFISVAGTRPLEGVFQGELVQMQATVRETARPGQTAINLAASSPDGLRFTQLNEGYLTLIPAPTNAASDVGVDGVLTISRSTKPASTTRATFQETNGQLTIFAATSDERIFIGRFTADRIRVRVGNRIVGDFPVPDSIVVEGAGNTPTVVADRGLAHLIHGTATTSISSLPKTGGQRKAEVSAQDLALMQLLQTIESKPSPGAIASPKRLNRR